MTPAPPAELPPPLPLPLPPWAWLPLPLPPLFEREREPSGELLPPSLPSPLPFSPLAPLPPLPPLSPLLPLPPSLDFFEGVLFVVVEAGVVVLASVVPFCVGEFDVPLGLLASRRCRRSAA